MLIGLFLGLLFWLWPVGMSLVDAHGAEDSVQMLSLFESYLEKQAVEDEAIYDRVRQGAVVFMGTLARHMDPGSPKVPMLVLSVDYSIMT